MCMPSRRRVKNSAVDKICKMSFGQFRSLWVDRLHLTQAFGYGYGYKQFLEDGSSEYVDIFKNFS